jgi:hypothetical protein
MKSKIACSTHGILSRMVTFIPASLIFYSVQPLFILSTVPITTCGFYFFIIKSEQGGVFPK